MASPSRCPPVRYAPPAVADAFCATRLGGGRGHCFGTLPDGADLDGIPERSPSPADG
ncbi:hypothetical protein [Streptomyces sp. NPDC048737]|uniref:hypothetical protein n=1 Tax=unclassified Streptomyces TaxID=2593676 RepID=UPI0034410B4A